MDGFKDYLRVRIAHVGWEGNSWDEEMQQEAFSWINRNKESLDHNFVDIKGAKNDYINLHQGRDFLQEDETYHIVILYHIYCAHGNWESFSKETSKKSLKDAGIFAVSQKHCAE